MAGRGVGGASPRLRVRLSLSPVQQQAGDGHARDEGRQRYGRDRVTDDRIEPIPCGESEWASGDGGPILEIARREGVVIEAETPG